jgi:hypothetical protein
VGAFLLEELKNGREFWTLLKELTDDEFKFYKYFRMSMYQFSNLLRKVQIYSLKKIHLEKKFHQKKKNWLCVWGFCTNNTEVIFPEQRHTIIFSILLMKNVHENSPWKKRNLRMVMET